MKKVVIILLISLIGQSSYSQDPSFSQFDLNMMYMNPAFVGYEKEHRILIHRRNQWIGIPENFNTNIIEVSPLYLHNDKNGILGRTSALALGFFFIEDHENRVFKNSTFGGAISYIGQLSKRDYINFAVQPIFYTKRLSWDELVFSDQWTDYGVFYEQSSAIQPSTNYNVFDVGSGILWTRHGKYSGNSDQRITIGFAGQHLFSPIVSFYGNQNSDSQYPIKLTLHGEFFSGFPDYVLKSIRFGKVMFRHQVHLKTFNKTEIGGMLTLANKIHLESGIIYRRARTYDKKYMSESLVPIIRMRLAVFERTGLEISYSYDYTISKLRHENTMMTNEISINLYFMNNKKRVCPAVGKWGPKGSRPSEKSGNNKKWEDVEFNRGKYNRFGKKNRGNW